MPAGERLEIFPQRYLVPGREDTLRVRAHGTDLPEDLVWESGDQAVARLKVLADGRVVLRGMAEGRTVITVRSESRPELRFGIGRWHPTAEVRVENDSIHSRAALVNRLDIPAHARYGACALRLRAYTDADRTGEPFWRSERAVPRDGSPWIVCAAYGVTARVEPGDTLSPRQFTYRIAVPEMLGDSLPDGVYHFEAVLHAADETFRIPAGSAEVRATMRPGRRSPP